MCRNGWFRGGPSNISAVAYGRWCRLRNGRFGYFRIHTDPRRSARGWTMGRPAKWFRKLCRRGRPCSHGDRKSTRLNSSHGSISYAVFCLKKKKKNNVQTDTKVKSKL